jgi:putative toxin-antitoxin system antitoxin component (TIGR02293 family)
MAKSIPVPVRRRRPPEVAAYLDAVRQARGPHSYVSLLGLKSYDTPTLHARVRAGLSFTALQRLLRVTALPMHVAAAILHIPPRTLQRRRVAGRLQPDESDRLVRLSRIIGKAIELFEGDPEGARQWLGAPVTALGGATPLALSQTEPGALEVEQLIGRLEHGVFS